MMKMKAIVFHELGKPLSFEDTPLPSPGVGQLRIEVEACALCRTDLHILDGELANPKLPLILGHEIVGKVNALGEGVRDSSIGERVGIAWLGQTCGHCSYCLSSRENLCEDPIFTGYTRDGGFAEFVVADARYVFNLSAYEDPIAAAPLMCAGLIGWRSLIAAEDGRIIGIYGFGAAAHIITKYVDGKSGRFLHSLDRATSSRRSSLADLGLPGSAAPMNIRQPSWMPPLYLRQSGRWSSMRLNG